jgi:hypothetical protein
LSLKKRIVVVEQMAIIGKRLEAGRARRQLAPGTEQKINTLTASNGLRVLREIKSYLVKKNGLAIDLRQLPCSGLPGSSFSRPKA